MIPLLHDFAGSTVLVFGGGPVGVRKARRFAAEADVVLVSPTFETTDLEGVTPVRASPTPADVPAWLDRATPALVVAATDDPAVNAAIGAAARDARVLVNRADVRGGRDPGSVVVPATHRDGSVVAAVATDGTSPALSAYLRERLAAEFDGAGAVAELAADVRTTLRSRDVEPAARRGALRAVVRSERVWAAAREGAPDADRIAHEIAEAALAEFEPE